MALARVRVQRQGQVASLQRRGRLATLTRVRRRTAQGVGREYNCIVAVFVLQLVQHTVAVGWRRVL